MTKPEHIDRPEVANRRLRLKKWIDENCGGEQANFLNQIIDNGHTMNQGELSGLLRKKSFGEKKASKLEMQAGMPKGYLDSQDDDIEVIENKEVSNKSPSYQTITPTFNNDRIYLDRKLDDSSYELLLKLISNYLVSDDFERKVIDVTTASLVVDVKREEAAELIETLKQRVSKNDHSPEQGRDNSK